MYRPNSIKTLMSLKKEKEEALSKSLSFHKESTEEIDKLETLSNPETELMELDCSKVSFLLSAVNETLKNLKTWKKTEKTEFEKHLKENEQKIKLIGEKEKENLDISNNLEKEISEMGKLQDFLLNQFENLSQKNKKKEIEIILKEYEDNFNKIKEANESLEKKIYQHQNFYGKTSENDTQYQFFKSAVESLNLEFMKKSFDKWQKPFEEFYQMKEKKLLEQTVNLENIDKIKIEKEKIQEKALEDSKISEKIKNEMEEIDKELEELEKILG